MAAVRPRGRLAREQKAIMTIKFDDAARARMLAEVTPDSFKYDGTPVREMDVRQVDAKFARKYIASFHYSRTMPDSTRFSFAGYMNGKVCGIVCYGMGCGKNQYTALIPGIENGTYVELTRLWCADSYPRNTESKLIAESLKLLPPPNQACAFIRRRIARSHRGYLSSDKLDLLRHKRWRQDA